MSGDLHSYTLSLDGSALHVLYSGLDRATAVDVADPTAVVSLAAVSAGSVVDVTASTLRLTSDVYDFFVYDNPMVDVHAAFQAASIGNSTPSQPCRASFL